MKKVWRGILTRWKESKSGSKFSSIPKNVFPALLKELMVSLEQNKTQNLISGFRKCGIFPIDKQILLDRLPENLSQIDTHIVGTAFLEQLEAKRQDYLGTGGIRQKKKKLQVPAGRSITAEDVEQSRVTSASLISEPKKSQKKIRRISTSSSSDDNSDSIQLESDEVSETFSDLEERNDEEKENDPFNMKKLNPTEVSIDDFVIVLYDKKKYPGKVTNLSDEGVTVKCMEMGLKCWKWPAKKDESLYYWNEVVCKIKAPIMISRRNQFRVKELEAII